MSSTSRSTPVADAASGGTLATASSIAAPGIDRFRAELALDARATLGECIRWDEREQLGPRAYLVQYMDTDAGAANGAGCHRRRLWAARVFSIVQRSFASIIRPLASEDARQWHTTIQPTDAAAWSSQTAGN